MSLEVSSAIAVVVSLLAGVATGALKSVIARRTEKHRMQSREDARRRISEIGLDFAVTQQHAKMQMLDHEPERAPIKLSDELLAQIVEGIVAQVAGQKELTGANIKAEVDKAVTELMGRLESIEARFPNNSSIDKIASINDALFAERIEQLSNRLSLLEQKQLTKWDVAITVSTVVAGICTVVGATYSVLKVLGVLAQ